jgi:hypothetical protein
MYYRSQTFSKLYFGVKGGIASFFALDTNPSVAYIVPSTVNPEKNHFWGIGLQWLSAFWLTG